MSLSSVASSALVVIKVPGLNSPQECACAALHACVRKFCACYSPIPAMRKNVNATKSATSCGFDKLQEDSFEVLQTVLATFPI